MRAAAITPEYLEQVKALLIERFSTPAFMDGLIKYLSLVQSGRGKHFVGSLAQMWKSLFKVKAVGEALLLVVRPFLAKVVGCKDAHARLTSDAYLGQQCMAAEVVAGLVRGIKYWAPDKQLQAQKLVREVLDFVVSIPEMESAGVWASGLRFAIFDRHPSRISWVMTPGSLRPANVLLVCC
jgi:hypothetical protein